jgi:hypothetical protein
MTVPDWVRVSLRQARRLAFTVLDGLADEVFTVERDDVLLARRVIDEAAGLNARDALHVAIMRREEISQVLTFDAGFDRVPGVQRLS